MANLLVPGWTLLSYSIGNNWKSRDCGLKPTIISNMCPFINALIGGRGMLGLGFGRALGLISRSFLAYLRRF